MATTLQELKEYLSKNVAELDLVEMLDVYSEDLVEAFSDRIEDNFDKFVEYLGLDEEEEGEEELG